jgi:DNA polymerase III delta prime subunit
MICVSIGGFMDKRGNLFNILVTIIVTATFSMIGVNIIDKETQTIVLGIVVFFAFAIFVYETTLRVSFLRLLRTLKFKLFGKFTITQIDGFYGRENIIKQIMHWHREKGISKCLFLGGYGGTGKSTIAKHFSESIDHILKVYVVNYTDKIPNPSDLGKDVIIFFDYALERTDDISSFIRIAKESKKRISIIIVERPFANDVWIKHKIVFDLLIDLNSTQNCISNESLELTLRFNVENDYDSSKRKYIGTNKSISFLDTKRIIDLIVNDIDKVYRRPIFAMIVAKLYLKGSFDVNAINTKQSIFEEYWDTLLSENKQKQWISKLDGVSQDSEIILNITKKLIVFSKVYSLVSAIARINISLVNTGKELYLNLTDPVSNDILNNEHLRMLLTPTITIPGTNDTISIFKVKNIIKYENLRMFFFLDSHKTDSEKGIRIGCTYDLVSAWLLRDLIKKEGRLLNSIMEHFIIDYTDNVYNSINRFIDENDHSITIWFFNLWFNKDRDFAKKCKVNTLKTMMNDVLGNLTLLKNKDSSEIQMQLSIIVNSAIDDPTRSSIIEEILKDSIDQKSFSQRDSEYINRLITELDEKHAKKLHKL